MCVDSRRATARRGSKTRPRGPRAPHDSWYGLLGFLRRDDEPLSPTRSGGHGRDFESGQDAVRRAVLWESPAGCRATGTAEPSLSRRRATEGLGIKRKDGSGASGGFLERVERVRLPLFSSNDDEADEDEIGQGCGTDECTPRRSPREVDLIDEVRSQPRPLLPPVRTTRLGSAGPTSSTSSMLIGTRRGAYGMARPTGGRGLDVDGAGVRGWGVPVARKDAAVATREPGPNATRRGRGPGEVAVDGFSQERVRAPGNATGE